MQDDIINSLFDIISGGFSLDGILNFILYPEFAGFLLFVKIIFIIISAILLINIFYLVALSSWFTDRYATDFNEFKGFKSIDAQMISKKWQDIKKRMKTGKETEYKLAVIEAEESLVSALKMFGNDGITLEDQLRQAGPDDLSDIASILKAHKVRNEIVNNPEGSLDANEAEKAIGIFEKAFEELQA